MPSHFHSACQSPIGPRASGGVFQGVGQAERVGAAVVGVAGVGRPEPVVEGGVGSQSPISRWATMAGSTPLTFASARVTSCCETPTRKPPLISLFQTNRWVRSIDPQASSIAAFWAASSDSRRVRSRSTQWLRGRSLDRSGVGRSRATVSATSPTASYDSPKSQSGTPAASAAHSRSFFEGTACFGFRPIRK